MQLHFIDELGQVSTKMLDTLDIILRKVRNTNSYLSGLLVIGTLDHYQLPPIKGKPFTTSPHILTSFEFVRLQHSVRASGDPDFHRLQKLVRLHPSKYEEYSALIDEPRRIIVSVCAFVDNWSSPDITPNTYCLCGNEFLQKR